VRALAELAAADRGAGRADEALALDRRTLAIAQKAFGASSRPAARAATSVGQDLLAEHRPAEALEELQNAVAVAERAGAPGDPLLAEPLLGVAEAFLALGRPAEAVPALERLFTVPLEGELRPRGESMLARALWAAGGDRDRARALALDARTGFAGDRVELARLDAWLGAHRIARR
jgi:tetratricopeptide (TPR) repeat protein